MRRTRGFTLIELIVSIAIIGLLVGVMGGFVWDVLRARDALEVELERERAAALLFDGLERDLQTVLATGPGGRSGIRGDGTQVTLATARTPIGRASGARATRSLGGVTWVRWRFDERARAILAERWTDDEPEPPRTSVALAEPDGEAGFDPAADSGFGPDAEDGGFAAAARSAADAPFAGASEDGGFTPPPFDPRTLGGVIARVAFRYHDGRDWRESFDARSGGLPVAVEVSVWFDPWPGDEPETGSPEDAGGGAFDDDTFAADFAPADADFDVDGLAAAEFADERPPADRRRIISVPDARAGSVADLGVDDSGGFEP